MYPKVENVIVVPITIEKEIIIRIQVCLILQMKINYKVNGGRKRFSCKSKHQYRASQYGEHDCNAHNKKNADYYEYPSLTHFTDEH